MRNILCRFPVVTALFPTPVTSSSFPVLRIPATPSRGNLVVAALTEKMSLSIIFLNNIDN